MSGPVRPEEWEAFVSGRLDSASMLEVSKRLKEHGRADAEELDPAEVARRLAPPDRELVIEEAILRWASGEAGEEEREALRLAAASDPEIWRDIESAVFGAGEAALPRPRPAFAWAPWGAAAASFGILAFVIWSGQRPAGDGGLAIRDNSDQAPLSSSGSGVGVPLPSAPVIKPNPEAKDRNARSGPKPRAGDEAPASGSWTKSFRVASASPVATGTGSLAGINFAGSDSKIFKAGGLEGLVVKNLSAPITLLEGRGGGFISDIASMVVDLKGPEKIAPAQSLGLVEALYAELVRAERWPEGLELMAEAARPLGGSALFSFSQRLAEESQEDRLLLAAVMKAGFLSQEAQAEYEVIEWSDSLPRLTWAEPGDELIIQSSIPPHRPGYRGEAPVLKEGERSSAMPDSTPPGSVVTWWVEGPDVTEPVKRSLVILTEAEAGRLRAATSPRTKAFAAMAAGDWAGAEAAAAGLLPSEAMEVQGLVDRLRLIARPAGE